VVVGAVKSCLHDSPAIQSGALLSSPSLKQRGSAPPSGVFQTHLPKPHASSLKVKDSPQLSIVNLLLPIHCASLVKDSQSRQLVQFES